MAGHRRSEQEQHPRMRYRRTHTDPVPPNLVRWMQASESGNPAAGARFALLDCKGGAGFALGTTEEAAASQ
jgi:hypothetical protein